MGTIAIENAVHVYDAANRKRALHRLAWADEYTRLNQHRFSLDVVEFTATPVPTISGGSGSGAIVDSTTVNSDGEITGVVWDSGGEDYEEDDVLTFTQGTATGTYILLEDDVDSGVLQDLSSKTIDVTRGTKSFPLDPTLHCNLCIDTDKPVRVTFSNADEKTASFIVAGLFVVSLDPSLEGTALIERTRTRSPVWATIEFTAGNSQSTPSATTLTADAPTGASVSGTRLVLPQPAPEGTIGVAAEVWRAGAVIDDVIWNWGIATVNQEVLETTAGGGALNGLLVWLHAPRYLSAQKRSLPTGQFPECEVRVRGVGMYTVDESITTDNWDQISFSTISNQLPTVDFIVASRAA